MSLSNRLIKTLNPLYKKYLKLHINTSLSIESLIPDDEFGIRINGAFDNLYCISLEGPSNLARTISSSDIDTLSSSYEDTQSATLFQAMVKDGTYQRNYIFSYNKHILKFIANRISANFLKDEAVINAIYDCFTNNEYVIRDKLLNKNLSFSKEIDYDILSRSSNFILKEAAYTSMRDYNVYQAHTISSYTNDSFNTKTIFKEDFTGVIWFTFGFNKDIIMSNLDEKIMHGLLDMTSSKIKKLKQNYVQGKKKLCFVNCSIFLKDNTENTMDNLSSKLGFKFIEISVDKESLIKNTPLLQRYYNFDLLADLKFLENRISATHKENLLLPDFYGIDVNGSFANFSFAKTTEDILNKNSHTLVLGMTGTGKTTTIGKILSQALNVGLSEDVQIKYSSSSSKKHKIRFHDIKKSFENIVNLVDAKYMAVDKINASLNLFSFNPFNIDETNNSLIIDRNELSLNILLLSITLESINKDSSKFVGLTPEEQGVLSEVIVDIYKNKSFTVPYVSNIENNYPVLYTLAKELGYKDNTSIEFIDDDRFSFFKKPIFSTVVNEIQILSNDDSNNYIQDITKSLLSKLRSILSLNIFNSYDKVNLKKSDFTQINYDDIKELDVYVPIFLSVFLTQFKQDKKDQELFKGDIQNRPVIINAFEEAKNIFSQKSFEDFLKKLTNEARSYGIMLLFITQLIEHVPKEIYSQLENIIILMPNSEKREGFIKDLVSKLSLSEESAELMRLAAPYDVFLWNSSGASLFSLDITQEEIEYFGQA